MNNLFKKYTKKELEIMADRNLAIDFMDGVHPQNSDLITELEKYITKLNKMLGR